MPSAPTVKVMVVDDSMVIRRAVCDALKLDHEIEVIGTASNGKMALDKLPELKPDVLILDIEMPIMSGIDVLRGIRKQRLHVRTIMFSTLTARGASQTMEALSLGAHDYIKKPSAGDNFGGYKAGLKKVAAELCPKIKQFRRRSLMRPLNGNGNAKGLSPATASLGMKKSLKPAPPVQRVRRNIIPVKPQIIAIGISTGGPEALAKMLPGISAAFSLPIVIVQHMPPLFTKLLAERLNDSSKLKVVEAEEGMALSPGTAYIAPGDNHLTVLGRLGRVFLSLNHDPPENSCRPAVDVLFRSVAKVYGNRALGVIMTGMGQDGLKGLRIMRERGASIFAQDEESSVVWGMPSYVVNEGLADKVLALEAIAGAIENAAL